MMLPQLDMGIDVVGEIFDCIELVNRHDESLLRERIEDDAYYENFISLTRQLAPDGDRVSHVGLTLQTDGADRTVAFNRKRHDWEPSIQGDPTIAETKLNEVRGILRKADATGKRRGSIHVVDEMEQSHKVTVPIGMMADIVRPMFDCEVVVRGMKTRTGVIILEDIELV
jgi:hypothetical protein